jgi:hypothetical protein
MMRRILLLLLACACIALDIEVQANKGGKPSYKHYLAKVKKFFNVTQ